MIIFKENDRIYFAASMYHYGSIPIQPDYECEENSPAWHIDDGKGTIAATTAGFVRASDILRYSDILNIEKLDLETLFKVSEKIPAELQTNCIIEEGQLGVGVCIARDDVAYEISKFGAIKKLGDVEVFNANRGVSMMIWENVSHIKDIEERMRAFFKILNRENNYNSNFPIMLINTKEKGYKLIYE